VIVYIPGCANVFADGLSRRPDLCLMLIGAAAPYDPWLKRIKAACEKDPVCKALFMQAKQGPVTRDVGAGCDELLHEFSTLCQRVHTECLFQMAQLYRAKACVRV
jgi:hypothetical protein